MTLSKMAAEARARSSSNLFLYDGAELLLELGLAEVGPAAHQLRMAAVGYKNLHERVKSEQIGIGVSPR
jgi:hypothetical protein